ncbi:MAG: 2-dehydropantoate 2-reductase N-terminal domain-containing protein, partial [Dehalococcoidia bacterium]|nr:2-dehydropantoate 2-reductase N-terminal domain-containing protein [Dehalococcoidia bacterium]
MKILVMGSGALGSVFGGFLSRRHEVIMIGRNPHVEAVRTQGLRVSGIWGDHYFANLKASTQIVGLPIQDLVLITTKSYDTAEAV